MKRYAKHSVTSSRSTKFFYKFCQELSQWHDWAKKTLILPITSHQSKEDIERQKEHSITCLLLRTLFLWFLKEHRMLPDNLFHSSFVESQFQERFSSTEEDSFLGDETSFYYPLVLKPLFFWILSPKKKAISLEQKTTQTFPLLREELGTSHQKRTLEFPIFSLPVDGEDNALGSLIDCPQLDAQASLFSPSKRPQQGIIIPNFLFFAEEESQTKRSKRKKSSTSRGLFSIFRDYAFSIDEMTEKEQQLTPEVLEKVFEFFLGRQKNKKNFRKKTGSFYTPKEIVDYIVKEILIAYFKNIFYKKGLLLENNEKKVFSFLEKLCDKETTLLVEAPEKWRRTIVEGIGSIKIFDPSSGSGAFLLGVVRKLLEILRLVDPDGTLWLDFQRAHLSHLGFDWTEEETKLLTTELDYYRASCLVGQNVFGADLQPLAVQITGLRLILFIFSHWKSEEACLWHIKLPLLGNHLAVANVLFGLDKKNLRLFSSQDSSVSLPSWENFRHLESLISHPLAEERRAEWRKKERALREALLRESAQREEYRPFWEGFKRWHPHHWEQNRSFFEFEWYFGFDKGFDIVLGNPPYVGHKSGTKELFRQLKKTSLGRRFSYERMDLFYYFFHFAIDITNDDGIISFITTNYFPTADSAKKLRQDITERARPFLFVDLDRWNLFNEARGQDNLLTFLSKSSHVQGCEIRRIEKATKGKSNGIFLGNPSKVTVTRLEKEDYVDRKSGYFLIRSISKKERKIKKLLDKILQRSQYQVGDFFKVTQGIVTGLDRVTRRHIKHLSKYEKFLGKGVFVVDEKFVSGLSPAERTLIKPWFKSSDILPYRVKETTQRFLLDVSREQDIEQYPKIAAHLNFYKQLILRRNYDSGELQKAYRQGRWWAFSSARKRFDFSQPKLVVPHRAQENIVGYSDGEWYASGDVYFITPHRQGFALEALLLLLNSKLLFWWLYYRGKRKGELLELYSTPLAAIPLPQLTPEEETFYRQFAQVMMVVQAEELQRLQAIADLVILEHYLNQHYSSISSILEWVAEDWAQATKRAGILWHEKRFPDLAEEQQRLFVHSLLQSWNESREQFVKRMQNLKEEDLD